MAYSATGVPLIVRYDQLGKPTGFKESGELNVSQLNVTTVSASVVSATVYTGPLGTPTFSIGSLSDVGDVVIPEGGLQDEYVLRWDSTTSKWYPANAMAVVPIEPTTSFSALTDTPSYYSSDQLLKSTGNSIVYSVYGESDITDLSSTINTLSLSSLSGVTLTDPAENDSLRYVAGAWVNQSPSITNVANALEVSVRNESGAQINKGKVVFVSGVHGTSAKKLKIGVASVNITNLEDKLLGVLTADIANNGEGVMRVLGFVTEFNTALSGIELSKEGSPVFLDPYTPGSITTIPPTKPTRILEVGILSRRDNNNGEIYVRFLRGGQLDTLFNVNTTGKTFGDVIAWNGSIFTVSAHAVSGLRDAKVSSPTSGQALLWNGTQWVNGNVVTAHSLLTGLSANDHPQYVLSATNQALSSLVTNLQSSAINTTNNISVLSANAIGLSSLVGNVESSTVSLSAYINANEGAWTGDPGSINHGDLSGLSANDHPQYVLSATNQALSSLVGDIETSTVNLSGYIAANEPSWLSVPPLDHDALIGLTSDDHDQYVFKAPEGADRNVIQPVADVPALILQESVSQTEPLLVLKNAITTTTMTIDGDGNIDTAGTLTAQSKSFLIDHPTKQGMKLQYTCLEGPENGVYCRGRVKTNVIVLPDYWVGLVDEATITVNLTPAGKRQPDLFVEDVRDNKIILSSSASIDCFYTVYAERKDIKKLIVEF